MKAPTHTFPIDIVAKIQQGNWLAADVDEAVAEILRLRQDLECWRRCAGQPNRCPEIVAGERCGRDAGHDGKHQWLRGD